MKKTKDLFPGFRQAILCMLTADAAEYAPPAT